MRCHIDDMPIAARGERSVEDISVLAGLQTIDDVANELNRKAILASRF